MGVLILGSRPIEFGVPVYWMGKRCYFISLSFMNRGSHAQHQDQQVTDGLHCMWPVYLEEYLLSWLFQNSGSCQTPPRSCNVTPQYST